MKFVNLPDIPTNIWMLIEGDIWIFAGNFPTEIFKSEMSSVYLGLFIFFKASYFFIYIYKDKHIYLSDLCICKYTYIPIYVYVFYISKHM